MDLNKYINVDIVLPVYNEEHCLENNVQRLYAYLDANANYCWRIIIADNASIDSTPIISEKLAAQFVRVEAIRLDLKGRGHALRSVFTTSQADVVMYMDVDLSTSLSHIQDLIESLKEGYDIAVGSRLSPGSHTSRSKKREFISRCYNMLVRIMFGNICKDFQCGFKALRRNGALRLLPEVKNNKFFFDTELLIIANSVKYRIVDVPVTWVEDPDSRVRLIPTILDDLAGLLRVRLKLIYRLIHRM